MNPVFTPVRELAEAVRTRQVSPVELAEVFLERLQRLGPRYNAVVTVTRQRALAQARRAEDEIAAGGWRGPLHGIPYGAKDLLATAGGIPTTWGAAPLRAQTFDLDATVVRRLEEAGAVLVAKLAMVELAGGMGYRQPHASFTGPGISPWGPDAWSGGSSSGSGSAVAAGLVPFAIGSETWGSILSPAANCGVSGLRPTYGRVSRHGAMALCWTLDKLGPLALTADDCGLVLDAIAGPDPHDPTAARWPYRYDGGPVAGRRFRFGVIRDVAATAEGAVREAFDRSLEVLRRIGSVEEITIADLPYEAITRTILMAEAASAFEDMIETGAIAGLTAPEDRFTAYARDAILAKDYIRALRLRTFVAREADRVLSGLDALVAPGRPAVASPLDREFRSAARGNVADVMGAIGNAAGLPSIAVPNGFSEAGLPTGLQFMGRAWEENTILAAARAWQAITDHHAQHPPRYPSGMTPPASDPFESLLSRRARIGWGVAVATPRPSMSALYEFGGGYPDPASFPYDGMVDATARMMKAEGAAAMTYGEPQGYRALRELICHKYERFEGFKAEPENIIVANGSGQALALAFSAFLDPGDVVIAEAPTFSGSLNTIRRHGPEILTVPVDDEGIVTGAVRERLIALRREGRPCKLIYTIVNFQNPAGPSQSLRRRHELIELAHEFETMILEDDAYGELRFEGETLPPLFALDRVGRVIRAGTLSKILGAGVRIGWLCAPRELVPAFQGFLFGGGVNPFMSRVATYYLRDHMVEHVERLIAVYRTKRDAMLRGLDEGLAGTDYVVSRPEGGFFLWMRLPTGTDTRRLSDLAVESRVQYTPGPAFYAGGGGEAFIRLAFSYESPEKCYEGARLLAGAIRGARAR